MLTQSQIDFFNENGFLRLEQVYSPAEMEKMSSGPQPGDGDLCKLGGRLARTVAERVYGG